MKKGANTDSKHERRRKRVLQSLSSSLLPLLINSSLWNLPTLFRAKDDDRHLLSPLSLYANACVSVLLLEFLSPSCEFLKQDIGKYILTLLYPIVEKACLRNIPMIQRSALHVISVIANACGFSDFSAFLRQEFNTLMACMSGRLRLPGGPQLQGDLDLENTVAVLSSSRWVLENAIRNIQDVTSWSDRASTSSMINLMSLLVDRFDHLFLRKLVSEKDFIEITLVYKSTFAYFLTIFGSSNDTVYSYRTKNPEDRSRLEWLDTLTFFRKSSMGDFCKINQEERNSDTEASVRKKASDKTLDVSMTEIDFASKLITRSSYFLSHESLGVRISACDSLTSGFRFLAFVACEYEVSLLSFELSP